MDPKLLVLAVYCYLLQGNTRASSFSHRIGNLTNISQVHEILNDFYADTGPFKRILSKYYYIEAKRKVNWFMAVHKCRELGAHLISLRNAQEFDEVIRALNIRNCYWTDLTDLAEQSKYMSMTTGLAASYLRWGRLEPNNLGQNEHCVQLIAYDKKRLIMNDNQCTRRCHFICETNLPSQTNIVIQQPNL
ncbi:C-type lectin 37Db-like [Drosophila novamexicana]|uniref:C-type lectin 37Db-like n=1 Tax=Drosophila novamexicana TaxID=47314 RepID=UPI0011E5A08A|nr:C-type lectin 37Db-like [Drosophila novamexicana]